MSCRAACLAVVLLGSGAASLAAAPSNLAEAVRAASPFWTESYLLAGANPNANLDGVPLLVFAVQAGEFEVARLLLQRGATVAHARRSHPNLLDLVPASHPEELSLNFLLRSFALIEEVARPLPPNFTTAPERVMIYEPTVDYSHPGIAPYYFVNEAEKSGRPGVDDDGNGFVDDVYGWSAASNGPHEATQLQLAVWDSNRPFTQRLVDLHNRKMRGEINENSGEWRKLSGTFLNPLAGIWGGTGGYSDADYLNHIINVSHGSHVAGIVIRDSRERARLHTLSWDTFAQEHADQQVFPDVLEGDTFETLLARYRQTNLQTLIQRGHRASDYLRVTRASVTNGSMGMNLSFFTNRARATLQALGRQDPQVREQFDNYARRLAYEFYAYNTIPFVIAIAENPQVLFVAAAGNSALNNDETLASPSYLSRFFRNVITVAASDANDRPATFTNRGVKSVNLAALGVNVESYGVAGTRMLMNGTSMAAPSVSGVGAYLRTEHPDATPETIRRALQIGARRVDGWANLVSSGGIMDVEAASALLRGDREALRRAVWSLLASGKDARPVEWAWLRRSIVEAAQREPRNADLNFAEAVALDVTGSPDLALVSVNRLLAQAPRPAMHWRTKLIIQSNLGDRAGILQTVQEFDRLRAAQQAEGTNAELASIYQFAIEAALALAQPLAVERWQERYAGITGRRYQPVDRSVQRLAREGALSERSTVANDRWVSYYRFRGESGAAVEVDLTSNAFDTFLRVRSPSGREWENDDYEGSTSRSRVDFTLPETGDYTIVVTTYGSGEKGAYRIEARGPTLRDLRVPEAGEQGEVAGALSTSSTKTQDGHYFMMYSLEVARGDVLTVDLISTEFDPLLVVLSPSGREWENDDFEGSTSQSQVSFQAPEAGVYKVVATTYAANATGAYRIRWQKSAMATSAQAATASELVEAAPLQPGETFKVSPRKKK